MLRLRPLAGALVSRVQRRDNGDGRKAHSSVERAALLASVRLHVVSTDDELSVRGATLLKVIQEDRKLGFIPMAVFILLMLNKNYLCIAFFFFFFRNLRADTKAVFSVPKELVQRKPLQGEASAGRT
ncbi:hypothetical protein IscW_ISCW004701 [Ixodes scapularis]|uniref:Uncharacterized protein n=1 Tax=Ixodes scapularis TaxID=6945 RepID=B7PIM1_IXOSC|nr:hypothetical protein IscW_ISCW004701 [Ixodes scapularis]|eukprot:XP_002405459.1 hypothetical protein IscW_ISCW004701 [Ixodes scapularis]